MTALIHYRRRGAPNLIQPPPLKQTRPRVTMGLRGRREDDGAQVSAGPPTLPRADWGNLFLVPQSS